MAAGACDTAGGSSPAVVTNDTATVDISSDSSADGTTTGDGAADTAADTVSDAAADGVADAASDIAGDAPEDAVKDTAADTSSDTVADVAGDVPGDTATVGWTLFKVSKGAGPCPPGMNCTWSWILDTTGGLTIAKQGEPSTAQMTAADFAKVSQFLGSDAFLKLMQNGFACGQPPTDIGVSFELALFGVMLKQDVTGCIFGQPADNLALPVYQVTTAY